MELHLFARTESSLEETDELEHPPSSRVDPVCVATPLTVISMRWVRVVLFCGAELGRAQRIAATHVLRQAGLLHAAGGVEQRREWFSRLAGYSGDVHGGPSFPMCDRSCKLFSSDQEHRSESGRRSDSTTC